MLNLAQPVAAIHLDNNNIINCFRYATPFIITVAEKKLYQDLEYSEHLAGQDSAFNDLILNSLKLHKVELIFND